MATTKAPNVYSDVKYEPDCYIMFGPRARGIGGNTGGKPGDMCRIPDVGRHVHWNLSNSVAVILYEALRQNGFEQMTMEAPS